MVFDWLIGPPIGQEKRNNSSKKWQYRVLDSKNKVTELDLNNFGRDGWELVSITNFEKISCVYTFKKRIL